MPPSRSRTAHNNAVNGKKSAAAYSTGIGRRKSLTVDPGLLQGSSDEDGEGPEDHEEQDHEREEHESNDIVAAGQRSSKNNKKQPSKSASVTSSAAAVGGPSRSKVPQQVTSPRRSTRLSGEGLPSPRPAARTAAEGTRTSPRKPSKLSAEIQRGTQHEEDDVVAPSRTKKASGTGSKATSSSAIPSKRKSPPKGSKRPAATTQHPTPPETDSDSKGTQPTSQKQRKVRSETSPTRSPRKNATILEDRSFKNEARPVSPALSSASDGSDGFAFTPVEAAQTESAPIASTSKHVSTEATASATTSSQSQTSKPSRAVTAKDTKTLLKSIKQIRKNEPRKADSNLDKPVTDRKGKRKADETPSDIDSEAARRQEVAALDHGKPTRPRTKKGRVAELSREDLDEQGGSSQSAAPAGTPARSSTRIPVNTQETPAIQRNVAMRAGLTGLGLPLSTGTPGSSTRRASTDRRGNRGSSIGNGFESLPHPSVPDEHLHRLIKPDNPPAIRFRTLATWSAHRLKDSMEQNSSSCSPAVRAAASQVMDSFIADLVEKRIDLSWRPDDSDKIDNTDHLPPNPDNIANKEKLDSCRAWIKRLQQEHEVRTARMNHYKAAMDRIRRLPTTLPTLPTLPATVDENSNGNSNGNGSTSTDTLHPNWSLPLPKFKGKEDILAYGRKLVQPKPAPKPPSRRKSTAAAAAANTTEDEPDPDVVDIQSEYPIDTAEIRHQVSSLRQDTYRVEQFLRLADTFVTQHLQNTQAALKEITRSQSINSYYGASTSTTTTTSVAGPSGSDGNSGNNNQAGSTPTAGTGDATSTTKAILGLAGPTIANASRLRGQDPLELLRAISRAETATKSTTKGLAK